MAEIVLEEQEEAAELERAAYVAGYLHGGSYPRLDDSSVGAYFREVTAEAYEDWKNRRGFWRDVDDDGD